jgi:hypothetical protein
MESELRWKFEVYVPPLDNINPIIELERHCVKVRSIKVTTRMVVRVLSRRRLKDELRLIGLFHSYLCVSTKKDVKRHAPSISMILFRSAGIALYPTSAVSAPATLATKFETVCVTRVLVLRSGRLRYDF